MARNGSYRYFCITIIIALLTYKPSHSVEQSALDTDSKAIVIKLKKCCWESSQGQFASCDGFDITWNLLKLYRVSKKDTGTSLVNNDQRNLMEGLLNCKADGDNFSHLQLSVPLWNGNGTPLSTNGLFSYFSPDGYLQHNDYALSPDEYCVESVTTEMISIMTCDYKSYCSKDESSEESLQPCLYRCCNYGEVWDVSDSKLRCSQSGIQKWKPHQYLNLNSDDPIVLNGSQTEKGPVIFSSHPRDIRKNCNATYSFHISNKNFYQGPKPRFGTKRFKILTNGTVWIELRKKEWYQINPGEYCIDGVQVGEGNYTGDSIMNSLLFECKVFETKEDIQEEERQRTYSLIFGIIITICLLFLLMTTIVYILLWSKHNIHGFTVFSYITTLLITYLLLGASHFATVLLVRKHTLDRLNILTFCGLLGIFCHFFLLCTFSWSTVLSFDLFCTFRTLRPRRNGKSNQMKKFLLYCLFAFAVPTFIVAVGILLDIASSTDVLSDVIITPDYGKWVCYLEPQYARFYFVIIPMSLLLGINFLLFCNTAYSVYKVKKATRLASVNSTKNEANNQTFRLILKLLLINGAVWVVEIISWSIQKDYNRVGVINVILDSINVFQAMAIFFLFVIKNDILESLKRKYPSLEGPVNTAFKLKNFPSSIQRSTGEHAAAATTSSNLSYKVKVDKNMPLSKL